MKIRKAVITAAGEKQRRLPLQTLVDRDGVPRSVLSILVREVLAAGAEEVCIVVSEGDQAAYAEAVPDHRTLLRFVPQTNPRGYADAIWRAREFTDREPFLHLVGDHMFVARDGSSCAGRLTALAEAEQCIVSAVRATHETLIGSFGVVAGEPVGKNSGVYRVHTVVEKPTPTVAEQKLLVPGLRSGQYLSFFGMHVLTPAVLDVISSMLKCDTDSRVVLSDALAELADTEQYLALQTADDRYDLGPVYGIFQAQLALALGGRDRDEVLASITTLLASGAVAR